MSQPPAIDNLTTFSELLDKLYLGASESDPWQSFLKGLKDLLDLQYATLMLRPPSANDSGLLFNVGADTEATMLEGSRNIYTENYFVMDPLIDEPFGEVVTLEEIMPHDKLLESDYYRLFLQPLGIAYVASMELQDDQGKRFSLRLTRGPEQTDFNKTETTYIKLFAPHLQRAVSQGIKLHQLDSERQVYAQSMSRRAIGIISLDKRGSIINLNTVAKRVLESKDGISRFRGQVHIKNKDLNKKFKDYIQQSLRAQHTDARLPINAIAVPRLSGKHDYEMVIKPLPVDPHIEAEGTPRLMILIQDPEQNMEVSMRLFMHLYGLTVSEATLAIMLAEGKTMDEAAAALGVTKNTARAHLRAVFAKTGVTQQSMLVSLVLTSLASMP